jgi:hypothetical protein
VGPLKIQILFILKIRKERVTNNRKLGLRLKIKIIGIGQEKMEMKLKKL